VSVEKMAGQTPPSVPTLPPPLPPDRSGVSSSLPERADSRLFVLIGIALLFLAALLLFVFMVIFGQSGEMVGGESTQSAGLSGELDEVQIGSDAENESPASPENATGNSEDAVAQEKTPPESGETNSKEEPVEPDSTQMNEPTEDQQSPPEREESIDPRPTRVRALAGGRSPSISAGGVNPLLVSVGDDSTVFVIDKSGSMSGNAFAQVTKALQDAIEKLTPAQRFSIIFFDDRYRQFGSNRLVTADNRGKDKAFAFIKTMSPDGGTKPYPPIELAMRLQPASIVVLSDGDFPLDDVDRITAKNRSGKRIVIHCVGLHSSVSTLRQLAENNAGTYRTARTSP
jgi:hypothetical protein